MTMMMMTDPDLRDLVRERMKEAAATERRLPSSYGDGPSCSVTFWPKTSFSKADYEEWTPAEKREWAAERLARQRPASPAEISRWEECLSWLPHIVRVSDRDALLAWARCVVDPRRSFRGWCRAQGICEATTGHRRVERAVSDLLAAFAKVSELWTDPAYFAVQTIDPDFGIGSGIITRPVAEGDAKRGGGHVNAWIAPDARPVRADYSDPAVAAATDEAIAAANKRAREIQRRRREKLGVVDAAV